MTHADPAAVAARMERIPNTRYTWVIVFLVAGALIVEALDIGSLGTILPIVKNVMNLRPSDVGLLAASSALGIVIGMIPAGYLADRYGRKPLLIGGMIWFASGTMIAALSPNFTVLLIVRGVSGLGMAATFIMPYSIVSEFVSRTSRGAFSGLLESALGLGYLLPPILGLIIVPLFAPEVAWRVFLVLAGLPLVYVWVIWWFLPESPRWLSRVGRYDEAERIVSMLERRAEPPASHAAGRCPDSRSADLIVARLENPCSGVAPALYRAHGAMIFGAAGISSMFYLGVNYIPSLFVERHIALSNAFVFTLVITAAQIPGRLLNGIVGEYIGRKWVYVVYTLVAASAVYFFGQSTTPAATVAWGALMWFSAPGSAPSYKIWYAEQYPTPIRATGQSTVESIGGRLLGGVIWTSIFPVLVASCGIAKTMSIVAGMALGALVIVTCFAPETYRRSVEELETQARREPAARVPSAAAISPRHPT